MTRGRIPTSKLAALSAIDLDAAGKELSVRLQEQRKDDADSRALRGKYAPPEGVCRAMYSRMVVSGVPTPPEACGGRVVPVIESPVTNIIGGGVRQSYVKHWYCEDCGLMYHAPLKGKG